MSEEFKRNRKRLKQSVEKCKLILENMNDLITIINENFEPEYINDKVFKDLLGYSKDEIIGKTSLTPLHPDDVMRAVKALKDGFKYGEGRNEMRVRHKDGHYIWMEHKGKVFIDVDGKKKALIISRDISEYKRAEKIIIEENEKLVELSQIKSDVIMMVSHEFKTPLSSVYAASQLLLNNFKDQIGSKPLEFIEIIYRGSQKIKQLIENLLDVSKLESGKLILSLKEENLTEIVNECVTDLKYWANKKNITVTIEIRQNIILKVDKIKIEQVVTNLLYNAIKYTPPNGYIYIDSNVNSQFVEISIKDTGIGLTSKEIALLFQKFGKIKRINEDFDIDTEGSGLGLYI
ncbi:MAG: PAS domain S-box protein [Candidatus Odinarchaeota archaeon]